MLIRIGLTAAAELFCRAMYMHPRLGNCDVESRVNIEEKWHFLCVSRWDWVRGAHAQINFL